MTLTRAITHIRLDLSDATFDAATSDTAASETAPVSRRAARKAAKARRIAIRLDNANAGKLAQLDLLADAYMALCQAYTTAFCTVVEPDKYTKPWIATSLSARWQQVAIQHAVGIARSWRTNHDRAYHEHLEDCAHYAQLQNPGRPAPTWKEWNTPVLTTSTGKRYGTFHGRLTKRHQRDREKRQRKAKLRACLKKKGVQCLPSLTNRRLARHVRQEINRAVNQFYADHPGYQVAYEALNGRGMRFHAKRMNAYLYASNLGHIPKQLAWKARKQGQTARAVWSAYSSQCCSQCSHTSKKNRPAQQTFCCQGCGFACHADENAAVNLQARFYDHKIRGCRSKEAIKALLDQRHRAFLNGCP